MRYKVLVSAGGGIIEATRNGRRARGAGLPRARIASPHSSFRFFPTPLHPPPPLHQPTTHTMRFLAAATIAALAGTASGEGGFGERRGERCERCESALGWHSRGRVHSRDPLTARCCMNSHPSAGK